MDTVCDGHLARKPRLSGNLPHICSSFLTNAAWRLMGRCGGPRRSQITLSHRAQSLHSSCWAVGDTVPRYFQVTVADSLRTRAIVFTLSCCAASHSARNAGAPGALNGGMGTPNRPQPSS